MRGQGQRRSADLKFPVQRRGLIERELEEELVIYDPEGDRAFLLNYVSTAIWDLCDGQTSERQIADEVARQFQGRADRVLEDVRATIGRFQQDGLVVTSSVDSSSPDAEHCDAASDDLAR